MAHARSAAEWLVLTLLAVGFAAYSAWQWQPTAPGELQITFLDIGQGDAIHLRTPSGIDLLIDGGPDRQVIDQLGRSLPPQDHTIEYVISTHPDADHIAGLAELPEAFAIGTLLTSGASKSTGAAEAVAGWAGQVRTVVPVQRGQRLELEPGLTLEFLHPNPPYFHPDEPNEDSVSFLLRYGEFSALFTGDAAIPVEEEIVAYAAAAGLNLDVDLLKAGHHGSRTSTGSALLNATTPEVVVISVGAENRYGHPTIETLWRISQAGATTLRTDQLGTIRCRTDGTRFSCAPL
jgi:beta-lactamase superfamily II metal-dependent hydrolase